MKLFNLTTLIIFAAALLIFTIACTDAASPVNISRVSTPLTQPVDAHSDEGQDAPRISLADAKKAFDERSATFIDTHVKDAYDAAHIPGAINITVQDLEAKINTIPKGKKIIAYCS